jgi:UDP-arabinose 4-epimerase
VPTQSPIPEDHLTLPVNPYGETKLTTERMLANYAQAYGLRWTALRYFNACGADPEGEIGEDHDPESHMIPSAIEAALGRRPYVEIFGTDYPTPDGTAIRDYIHVTDLGRAHVRALEHLNAGGESTAVNLGTGKGNSVREVIAAVQKMCAQRMPVREGPRRAGDPPVLVAGVEKARQLLGWAAEYRDIDAIVETAWKWHVAHQQARTA